MQDGRFIHIMHLMDDASRWRLLEHLESRQFADLSESLLAWVSIFGEPEKLVFDCFRRNGCVVRRPTY